MSTRSQVCARAGATRLGEVSAGLPITAFLAHDLRPRSHRAQRCVKCRGETVPRVSALIVALRYLWRDRE
jgi:hypothetical protein